MMMWMLLHCGVVDVSVVDKPWDGSTRSIRYLAVLVGHLWGLLAGERTRVGLHLLFQLMGLICGCLSGGSFGMRAGEDEERLGQGQSIC